MVSEIPDDRIELKKVQKKLAGQQEDIWIQWGGFMNDIDSFDAKFFGITPREAELMDPQHRIFIETVWMTIEDAGYKPSDLWNTKTGVYVGVSTLEYNDILKENGVAVQAQTATGNAHSVLANRISYMLNLHGPSEPIDTACSSSLTAIHHASEAIRHGECDMAIAGGVNVLLSPTLFISFSKAGMLSPDGKCKTFDENANGYVRGEGCGAILMKPLSRVIADGDHIYAVIRDGYDSGGHVNTLTSPNPNAQAELISDTWMRAGISPDTITYMETHGTGTPLGDPIEINGLKKAFGRMYEASGRTMEIQAYCGIGAVKSNIGHLEMHPVFRHYESVTCDEE